MTPPMTGSNSKFDVALSFAGEDRGYVHDVAQALIDAGVSVFYDEFEQIKLWGKDLVVHLDNIYRHKARYCVMFISSYYAAKVWTNHELKSALARALEEENEYILPARFDDTELPGIRPTIGYVNLRDLPPNDFANLILEKIGHTDSVGRGRTASQQTNEPTFRKPNIRSTKSFNPYSESRNFIEYVANEIANRCSYLSDDGVDFSVFERNSRKCIRILLNGRVVYSIDIWMGGVSSDSGLSFYGSPGELLSDGDTFNAWGSIVFDGRTQSVALNFHDMSLLRMFGEERQISFGVFVDELWNVICEELERQ
jgi:hypothetical protein